MRPWPKKHRQLAMLMVLLLIGCTAVYFFAVSPRKHENARMEEDLGDLRNRLARSGWPLQAERLEAALEEMKLRLEGPAGHTLNVPGGGGVKARSDLVLARATAMFSERIRTQFGTPRDFVLGVSRLDYQSEFNRLQRKLAENDVWIAPDILNLAEDSASPYTYQLVLQVWTLDSLTDLALEHGLVFETDSTVRVPTGGREARAAARLSVRPPKGYVMSADDARPFLVEFPIRLELRGTVDNTMQFLQALTAPGFFLPVSHLQLFSEDPAEVPQQEGGRIRVSQVRLDLECSSFFQLDSPRPDTRPTVGDNPPQGV